MILCRILLLQAGIYIYIIAFPTLSAGLRIRWLYPHQTIRPFSPTKRSVLCMILNCIRWWGSSFGGLVSVEYPFIAITPRSTWSYSTLDSHLWVIYICFENYSYSMGPCAKKYKKKFARNNYKKICKQRTQFSNTSA